MKIKIKEVPRNEPNADGVWRECEVSNDFANLENKSVRETWDKLKSLRGIGKEIVAYDIVE